jgi:hypothetical protein
MISQTFSKRTEKKQTNSNVKNMRPQSGLNKPIVVKSKEAKPTFSSTQKKRDGSRLNLAISKKTPLDQHSSQSTMITVKRSSPLKRKTLSKGVVGALLNNEKRQKSFDGKLMSHDLGTFKYTQ